MIEYLSLVSLLAGFVNKQVPVHHQPHQRGPAATLCVIFAHLVMSAHRMSLFLIHCFCMGLLPFVILHLSLLFFFFFRNALEMKAARPSGTSHYAWVWPTWQSLGGEKTSFLHLYYIKFTVLPIKKAILAHRGNWASKDSTLCECHCDKSTAETINIFPGRVKFCLLIVFNVVSCNVILLWIWT